METGRFLLARFSFSPAIWEAHAQPQDEFNPSTATNEIQKSKRRREKSWKKRKLVIIDLHMFLTCYIPSMINGGKQDEWKNESGGVQHVFQIFIYQYFEIINLNEMWRI